MLRTKPGLRYLLLVGLLVPLAWWYINLYPKSWSRLQSGMAKSDVQAMIGAPQMDWNKVKGCFWFHELPFVRHRLQIVFNEDQRANFVLVTREIGTRDNFFFTTIYSSGLTISSTRTPPALPFALSQHFASSAPFIASTQAGPVSCFR